MRRQGCERPHGKDKKPPRCGRGIGNPKDKDLTPPAPRVHQPTIARLQTQVQALRNLPPSSRNQDTSERIQELLKQILESQTQPALERFRKKIANRSTRRRR